MIYVRSYLIIMVFMILQINSFAASAGFNNDITDARSLGNSNAVIARPLSAATNWYNPAGLTEVTDNQISISYMNENTYYELDSTTGIKVEAEAGHFHIPSLYGSFNLDNNLSFGFGINTAYALTTEWEHPITDYVATKSEFIPINFNPNLAYKFNDKLSAAIGLDISYAEGQVSKKLNQTLLNSYFYMLSTGMSTVILSSDAESSLEGDDTAIGWNFGILHKTTDALTIGFNYRSEINYDLDGEVSLSNLNGPMALMFGGTNYSVDGSMKLSVPETFAIGFAYKLSDKTSCELDFELAKWSQVDKFQTKYKGENDPVRLSVLNTGNPIEKDWDDTLNFAFGVEHQINDKNTIFCGTRYRPSPVPETTFDPSIPSCDLLDFDCGFSINFESSRLDFTFAYVYGMEEDVDNNVGNSSGASVDGKYSLDVFVFGATYTIKL